MKVIVLGGGVAGMSAAHELAERGFEVVVFEARAATGGKARSFPFPGSATQGRPPLPGEHGFRFFPGFYRHAQTELDNLLLASDHVRTYTDLATMEGANEAARRAVNAILERSGSDAERCGVSRLREPELFAPARALDRVLFKLGRPPRQQLRMADGRVRAAPYLPLAEGLTG